jgi:hypothetical protein
LHEHVRRRWRRDEGAAALVLPVITIGLVPAVLSRSVSAAVRVLCGLVRGVVVVVGVATVVGLLDRVWWVLEAADVFRLQYLVVLVAAGVAALLLRRPRLAVLAAALAAVNVAVLGVPLRGVWPPLRAGRRPLGFVSSS